jgi:hypothetical protein
MTESTVFPDSRDAQTVFKQNSPEIQLVEQLLRDAKDTAAQKITAASLAGKSPEVTVLDYNFVGNETRQPQLQEVANLLYNFLSENFFDVEMRLTKGQSTLRAEGMVDGYIIGVQVVVHLYRYATHHRNIY